MRCRSDRSPRPFELTERATGVTERLVNRSQCLLEISILRVPIGADRDPILNEFV